MCKYVYMVIKTNTNENCVFICVPTVTVLICVHSDITYIH